MADRKLFLLVSMIIAIGIIMSYSLSTYIVLLFDTSQFHFALRQLLFGIVSILIMYTLAQQDPNKILKPLGFFFFFGGAFLMFLMPFLPTSLVTEVGGAARWIKLFGFSLAPVEFFKVGFVYFLAWSFDRRLGNNRTLGIKDEFLNFLPYAFIFLVVVFLIAFMQNDLGQIIVLALTLAFMMLFAGSSFKFFITITLTAILAFILIIVTSEHRILRIKSWWATAQSLVLAALPESIASHLRVDAHEEAYQIGHSLNAISNGGIFGVGFGNGSFKLGFLSEVHTDFVLAGIAEEFGFIGVLFVTFLFIWTLQRIFKIANRSDYRVHYLFSLGIGLLLVFAFMLNAYGISGLTPIKGISVPFLSYGGSSMIAASFGVGMVLMISRRAKIEEKRRRS